MKSMSPLNDAVVEVLRQGEALLAAMSDDKYTRRLPAAFNSAVGGHYRHCLDHFQSLLHGLDSDEINYDHRARDKRIENDRAFAQAETKRLMAACQSIPAAFLECSVMVRSQVSYDPNEGTVIRSTVGREIMYAVAHCIHHYALIAVMCRLLEVSVPESFGIAPSTIKYQARHAQAA